MIECELIPDGMAELPAEARDHGILWSHLSGASVSSASPETGPGDVVREVRQDRLILRLDGALADHSSTTLDNMANAIVNNISGVKKHPDGWQDVNDEL